MRTSQSCIRSSLYSAVRDALFIALAFALGCLSKAGLTAYAQRPVASAASASGGSSGWVVIPVEAYQSLRGRAFPAEREPEPPPVEATLTRVDYDLRVNGELATGQASLTVDVIKDGWVRVPIPSGLLVREARVDGKEVSLVSGSSRSKGGNQLSAVLAHAGRALLLLDVALPVAASAGEESITLPSTSSGITRAALQVPRLGVDVNLKGGLLAEKAEAGNVSKLLAYGHGTEPLTFTWRRKLEERRETLPLRMRGSLIQLTGLGEDAATMYAEVTLEILQGGAKEARIHLPEKVTINQVAGAMVSDWEIKDSELVVTFLEPVEQNARFTINGETHTTRDGLIEVPLLRLSNVERESGGLAVEVLGAGEIKDQRVQGLENADAADLGDSVAGRESPSLVAFRYRSGDAGAARSLTVNVARYDQQAVLMANVEEARYQVLMSNEGKTLVQARYAIRNNQRNFLKITLPQGAEVWSAVLAGKPVHPGQTPDGSVLLPLEKSRGGDDAPAFAVELVYLSHDPAWTDKGKARLTLPALDLPISRTGAVLYHAPQFKVTGEPGTFRTEPYAKPVSAALNQPASDSERFAETSRQPRTTVNGQASDEKSKALDDFRARSMGGHGARVLPIRVSFPAFGATLFFVSELTGENQRPAIELSYQREKKEGGQ